MVCLARLFGDLWNVARGLCDGGEGEEGTWTGRGTGCTVGVGKGGCHL